MRVREATVDDAPGIAEVHVRAWQAAYRGGLMPDDYLDALSIDDRTTLWSDTLSRPSRPRTGRWVAVDDAGVVLGFTVAGPERLADGAAPSDAGELHVLNVHPEAWGRGVGETLLRRACDGLTTAGFDEGVLWVVPGNGRARRFYERHGWTFEPDTTRVIEVHGVDVPEVRYRRSLAA